MVELKSWLEQHGLGKYARLLADNAIDIDILAELTEEDLENLSLPLGDRKRLLRAAADLASARKNRRRPATTLVHEAARASPQRRQLTILFCDLVGSTGLSTRLDPEDMRDIILDYQSACAREITRYEGQVAKYMGDGVLAYFGWPIAHENDAERAVRAGLSAISAVAKLATQGGEPLAARVGVATGIVVVGDVIGTGSSQEEAVVGETPNLAARLQQLAAPGRVVISDATRRLTGELFQYLDLGEQALSGFGRPVRCWQATAETQAGSRFAAMRAFDLSPVVGREEDLSKLRDRWDRAKRGRGQVLLVSGEPGIGKSRIVESLERQVGERHASLHYHCSPFYRDTALYPLISQFELAAGIRRNDTPAEKLEKLQNHVGQYSTDPVDVALMAILLSVPRTAQVAPLNLTPEKQKSKILGAFAKELSSLASRRPVLVVFEDLHWADPTTLEHLAKVIELIRDMPVLLAITFRPEFEPPWPSDDHVTTMTLHRLDRRSGSLLIRHLSRAKALPPEITDEILTKSDGVPLYIEELTKAVLSSDFLRETDDAFVLSGQHFGFVVPASLHDSLIARLDRMGPVKEVAQLAATLGRTFSLEILAAVSTLPQADLVEQIAQLVNAELLQAKEREQEEVYEFKHALIRDVAYQSLLRNSRRAHHQRIAYTVEAQFRQIAEKEPEYLAHHFTEAQLVAKAIPYWQAAGNRAKQRSANVEAVAHYSKAIELAASLPEAMRHAIEQSLRIALGPALMAIKGGANRDVQDNYTRARRLAEKAAVGRDLFPVLFGLFRYYVLRAELQTAEDLAKQLLSLATRENDAGLLIESSLAMGATLFWIGDTATAAKHLRHALDTYDRAEHSAHALVYGQDPYLISISYLALSDWTLGFPDRAVETIGKALGRAGKTDHLFSRAYALYGAAWVHQLRREPRECLAWAEACLELSSEQGFRYFMGLGAAQKGWVELQRGAPEGLKRVQDGVSAWSGTGALASYTYHHSLLADAYLRAGKAEEALGIVTRALDTAKETGEHCWESELHRMKGEILLTRRDNAEQAERCLHDALSTARARHCRGFELRAATSLARLWHQRGKRADARQLLGPVYRSFSEGFGTADLKDAAKLLGEIP